MRRDLMARYAEGADAVDAALAGVDLDSAADGWTPRQIVHHLADLTVVNAARLRRLIAEDEPFIPDVNEELYATTLHYERGVETSMAVLRAAVDSNLELIDSLSAEEWARKGKHEAFGEYSIEYWLERQANHLHEHADQIARCKAR